MKNSSFCSTLLLLFLFSLKINAQISIPSYPYSYTQQFTGFNGTIAGLPPGWALTGTTNARGQGNGSSNTGGMWAYGISPEYALGALSSGTSANINFTVSFKNNAATAISSLTIAYNFEQWRYGGGNTNGFTVSQSGIGASVSGLNTVSGPSTTGTATVTPKSITLNGLSIAPNATFSITWTITDGAGNDNGVAIDNFSLTAGTSAVTPAVVTVDPVNVTSCNGAGAAFSVTATNTTGYQWQEYTSAWSNLSNGGVYAGVNTATLTIINNTGLTGRQYRCIALGANANDTSAAAGLQVDLPTTITSQPFPASVCPASDTSFTIAATGINLTYQWQIDTGSGFTNIINNATYNGATTNTLRIIQASAGMNAYLYRCSVSGACPPSAVSNAAVLTVYQLPPASITPAANFNFCQGDSILLNANAGPGFTYQWLLNTAPQASGNDIFYKNIAAGSYSVIVTDTSGCSNTSASVVATAVAHTATITSLGSLTFCTGGQVKLAANNGNGFTYQWLKDGSFIPGSVTDTLIANTSGNYQAVVTNGMGCIDTSMAVTVVSNTGPAAVIVPQGSIVFCAGDSVVLDAGFQPGLTYEWFLNGTPLPGVTNANYVVKDPGSYTVKVASSATCHVSSAPVIITVKSLPAALLSNASALIFCQGDSVVLAANTGTGYSYQWYRNNTPVTGSTNDSLTVNTSGQYTVKVTSANGCSNSANALDITVNPLPVATITPSANAAICQGDSLLLTSGSGPRQTYRWFNGPLQITGVAIDQFKARTTGSYSVLVADSNGCEKRSTSVSLTVNSLPSVGTILSGPAAFCEGGSVVIGVPSATNHTYQWYRNSAGVAGAAATYTTNTGGSYQVLVTNTSTSCKSTSAPVYIVVYPLPAASQTISGPAVFCAGDSTVLSAGTGSLLIYKWILNGQPIAGASASQYPAKIAGRYSVMITDSNSCTRMSDTQEVKVNPMPGNTITYGSPLSFCEGGAVVLTALADTGITYQWLKNGQPQGINTPSNIVDASGSYSILQTNSFNCTNVSSPVPVTVWPSPQDPIISMNGLQLSTSNFASYQWYRNNQTLINGNTRTILAETNGAYSVEVVNLNGCRAQSAIVFVNNVGIGGHGTKASIRIYPNPVQDVLTITAPFKVNAVLLDMQGRRMLEQGNAQNLSLKDLPAGLYLLQIRDMEGMLIKTEKIRKIN